MINKIRDCVNFFCVSSVSFREKISVEMFIVGLFFYSSIFFGATIYKYPKKYIDVVQSLQLI